MPAPTTWSDEFIVVCVGNLLRVGVVASAAVILAGGLIHLYYHGGEVAPDRRSFTPAIPEFSRPTAIARAAMTGQNAKGETVGPGEGRGRALIQLGLLVLIGTPVMRVAFSIFAFARQRDVVYVILPMIVLAVLIYGLFSGQMQ
jgi:uncharacterized membrane protein